MFSLLLVLHEANPTSDRNGSPPLPDEDTHLPQRVVRAEMHLYRRHPAYPAAAADPYASVKDAPPLCSAADDSPATAAAAATNVTPVASTPVAASPNAVGGDAHQSRQLLLLAVPHTLSTTHLLRHIADLPLSTVHSCTRIIQPRSRQHSLLITFQTADEARNFYRRVHNHAFHAQRREMAYALYIADADVEERVLTSCETLGPVVGCCSLLLASPTRTLELPSCPRCFSKLDGSLTDIVTELDDFSIVRVRAKATTRDTDALGQQTKSPIWTRRRIPIWPEIDCPTCRLVAPAASDTHIACQHCVAAASEASCLTEASSSHAAASSSSPSSSSSSVHVTANTDNSLWVCLLCGHVGCGRYSSSGCQHAFAHSQATRHNYAMECTMGYIWDYANDGYIHRVRAHSFRKNLHAMATTDDRREDAIDEQKADDVFDATLALDSDLVNWSGWNDLPKTTSSALAAAAPPLTRAASYGFSVLSESMSLEADGDASRALLAASDDGSDPLSLPDYGLDVEEESALLHSKLESIATFYNDLLNETLTRQYEYFTQRAQETHEEDERQRTEVEPAMVARLHALQAEIDSLQGDLASTDAANKLLNASVREWSGKVARLAEENAFTKEINRSLLADQMAAKKKKEAASTAPPATMASPDPPAAPCSSAHGALGASSSVLAAPSALSRSYSSSSAPAPALAPASSSFSVAPSPLSELDPSLVARFTNLREEKSKQVVLLEKEVARLMEEIEARTKKEQLQQQQAEAQRKQRIHKSLTGGHHTASSGSSARGRRG